MKTLEQHLEDVFTAPHEMDVTRVVSQRDAEWRRLVEEAQAETLKLQDDLLAAADRELALEAERDRLKGELAMERSAYDTTLYRLKGELTEARELTEMVRENAEKQEANLWEMLNVSHRGNVKLKSRVDDAKRLLIDANIGTRLPIDVREAIGMWLAATPAEQAQPPGRDLDICAHPGCAKHRGNSDHWNLTWPGHHEFVEQPAEQAQGEAYWKCSLCRWEQPRGTPCNCVPWEAPQPADPVAELAKRVDALESWARVSWRAGRPALPIEPAPPPPEVAAPCLCSPDTYCELRAGRPLISAIPPYCKMNRAEAAGPGLRHMFRCMWSEAGKHSEGPCGEECPCVGCGRSPTHLNHAVPPIPEGT